MRWEIAPTISGNETYHLYKDDRKILALSINAFSSSARIEFEKEKRVILIRKEGFRKRKIVLRNEYGIKIGELGHENKQEFIDMNEDHYYYNIRRGIRDEIVLYRETIDKPLMSCQIDSNEKNLEGFIQTSLVMALCWYLHLPAAKEQVRSLSAVGLPL